MNRPCRYRSRAASLVLIALALTGPARAATTCVSTADEFRTALESAAATADSDAIIVRAGSISVGSVEHVVPADAGALVIRGGGGADGDVCAAWKHGAQHSSIVGDPDAFFRIESAADVALVDLTLEGFAAGVSLQATANAELSLSRVAVFADAQWDVVSLAVDAGRLDVENVLIDAEGDCAMAVHATATSGIEIANATVRNSRFSGVAGCFFGMPADRWIVNSVFSTPHSNDALASDFPLEMKSSVYGGIAWLAPASTANLVDEYGGNANASGSDARYLTLEPTLIDGYAIDSGEPRQAFFDVLGRPRTTGEGIDRGALETQPGPLLSDGFED